VASRLRDDRAALGGEHDVGKHHDHLRVLTGHGGEGRLERIRVRRFQHPQLQSEVASDRLSLLHERPDVRRDRIHEDADPLDPRNGSLERPVVSR